MSDESQFDEKEVIESTNLNVGDLNPNDFGNFDYTDEDQLIHDPSEYKYTKIDCLDEDPLIIGQRFVCLSFVSPEGVMNCNVRGLKIRGVFGSESEAQKAAERFRKIDPNFDVLVGEVGKWLPWNPTTRQIEKMDYKNKKLGKMMDKIHKSELNTLNELVGRTKETIKNSRVAHKNRMRQNIKENIASMDDVNDDGDEEKEEKEEKPKKNPKNDGTTRERLRKKLEKKKEEELNKMKLKKSAEAREQAVESKDVDLEKQKELLKQEGQRIVEKENNLKQVEQQTSNLTDKITQMRELIRQRKAEKNSGKTNETSNE